MITQTIFTKSPWMFLLGAPKAELLPMEGPPEIAFSGRSNVGKSSLINILLNRKKLSRTSNSPGRTQDINYFVPEGYSGGIDNLPPIALVDMPGYGYAKAPKKNVDLWRELIFQYLSGRSTLKRVYLLIDSRHGIKTIDQNICSFLDKKGVSYQIILTKIDKISPLMAQEMIDKTKNAISAHPAAHPDIISTSSVHKSGIETIRKSILEIINY